MIMSCFLDEEGGDVGGWSGCYGCCNGGGDGGMNGGEVGGDGGGDGGWKGWPAKGEARLHLLLLLAGNGEGMEK